MKIVIFFLALVLIILGYISILPNSAFLYILYIIFVLCNSMIIKALLRTSNIRLNVAYIFLFFCWLLFNSLGFLHTALVDKYKYHSSTSDIYIFYSISSLLLYLPIKKAISKRGTYKPFHQLDNFVISRKMAITFVAIMLGLQLYKIVSSGGLIAYMFAAYGEKVDSSQATFFHLFGGLVGKLSVFLMPFILRKDTKIIRWIVILNIVIGVLLGAIGGSSSSFLWPVFSIFMFVYFLLKSNKTKRKLKLFLFVGVFSGVFIGMMIRVNRYDNSNFQLIDLKSTYEEIMLSPTFDNITNLRYIYETIEPIYEPNQMIYPFVHYLPRVVFPWKPMPLGRIVGVKFIGVTEESRVAFITGPIGDFYYDFGVFGIIFGILFCGWIIGYTIERLNSSKFTMYSWSIYVAFAAQFVNFTSWYTGWFSSFIDLLIVIIIVVKLKNGTKRNGKRIAFC